MIRVLATNITSPLGLTTDENYQSVLAGRSALTTWEHWQGLKEPFAASMFSAGQDEALALDGFTRYESMVVHSVADALARVDGGVAKDRTVFILSTTKGNVAELGDVEARDAAYLHPGDTARKIARHFGITSDPIVVCNACISGVTGQLVAKRLIAAGLYDYAVVCGADSVTKFIVTGFQSFKALSPYPCRPFDIERLGLNVGEAAATMVFGKAAGHEGGWMLEAGCTNNDAYHVSAPSPVGDGAYRAICQTMQGLDPADMATICVHGTATMFNDQMESKAIQQAGLSDIPLTALKGYYGHTMGAAGVLETILTMRGLDDACILPTRGFDEIGVSGKVTISNTMIATARRSFLKIISGFGGCNGALYYRKHRAEAAPDFVELAEGMAAYDVRHRVHIDTSGYAIDGQPQSATAEGKALLTEIYKQRVGDYPKYYKMDMLCRLAFVAAELLVQQEADIVEGEERGIVLFNRTSSIDSDRKHLATLVDGEGLPSPSVFLYTLPNILTGEIAIRHAYKGESSLYILEHRDEERMAQIVAATFGQSSMQSLVTGWVDCQDETHFEADLQLVVRRAENVRM